MLAHKKASIIGVFFHELYGILTIYIIVGGVICGGIAVDYV